MDGRTQRTVLCTVKAAQRTVPCLILLYRSESVLEICNYIIYVLRSYRKPYCVLPYSLILQFFVLKL